jgi:glycosyltransferase involved in cell wall biosynthesis
MQLIHSGRLSEGKGTFLFLDVCRSLKEFGIRFQAKITGAADDATQQRVRETITSYGLEDYVQFLGRLPEESLMRLLRGSDVLVHLSTIDSYPLIVLESIACSTFPICVNLAGATDMVSSYTGHIVTLENAVAQTVAFLVQCPLAEIRALSSIAAHRVRADYAWAQSVGVLRAAICETMQANSVSA